MSEIKISEALNAPMISVLLPAYNAEVSICQAINSILSQTYSDFELIIIDDGSTDKTAEIVTANYDDSRIKFVSLVKNLGIVNALNTAISISSGNYIARMDADDVSRPDRFLRQIEFLEVNPDHVACGTAVTIFNDNTSYDVVYPHAHGQIMAALQLFHRSVCHPSVMMRSAVIHKHNIRYSSEYPHAEDYALWKELSNYGKLFNLNDSHLLYRYHEEQISSKYYKTQITSSRKLLEAFLKAFLEKGHLNFERSVYINFLVQEGNADHIALSHYEAKHVYEDLLVYVKQSADIDVVFARKILLSKYCLAGLHYHHSFFNKIKACLHGLFSSPYLMVQIFKENYRHFYFKKINGFFKRL